MKKPNEIRANRTLFIVARQSRRTTSVPPFTLSIQKEYARSLLQEEESEIILRSTSNTLLPNKIAATEVRIELTFLDLALWEARIDNVFVF